jgi:hypothetical protein
VSVAKLFVRYGSLNTNKLIWLLGLLEGKLFAYKYLILLCNFFSSIFIFSLQIAGSLEIAGSPSDVAVYSLVALSQCHIIFVFIL